jgi:Phosphotransferase enzyme family
MSEGEHRLRSRSDFQRFCAELRTSSPTLDDLVVGLRELAASSLRPLERGRFAHSIARHLGESFHASEVRAVASVPWPPEIAMALRSHAPGPAEPLLAAAPEHPPEHLPEPPKGVDLVELSRERASPLTVVLMGDEDEHRASIERLKAAGIHCLRESSLRALREAFDREAVVGLVVGASWWALDDPELRSSRQRLASILQLSNLCWVKLIRTAAWASLQTEVLELCMSLHFSHPPMSRFAVEDQATITDAELRCLGYAAHDLFFAERSFSYAIQLSPAQDRILRAASSRYLREKYPTVHAQESGFRVRALADRGEHGLASLVSVTGTDVAFVVKVSPYAVALEEARRFRSFAHGASFEMEFFCHGMQGALVFAPIDTRLGQARSLEDMLAPRELVDRRAVPEECIAAIDSAIAALRRFSQQLRPAGVTTFCNVEHEGTQALLASCGPLVVAGQMIDPRKLFARGLQALDRCSQHAIVHGDAHPGNILFSATGTAILIDYECAGSGPACYDLCTLWIHVLASRFIAVGDERSMVGLVHDLLVGLSFAELEAKWSHELRFAVSHEVVYLAHEAIRASVAVMAERGCAREDVYGIVAIILCRELLNPGLQQFAIRCALAATALVLDSV